MNNSPKHRSFDMLQASQQEHKWDNYSSYLDSMNTIKELPQITHKYTRVQCNYTENMHRFLLCFVGWLLIQILNNPEMRLDK